jgi:hypothetical protein
VVTKSEWLQQLALLADLTKQMNFFNFRLQDENRLTCGGYAYNLADEEYRFLKLSLRNNLPSFSML